MPRTPPTSSPPTPRHPSAGAGNVAAADATCLIPSVFRFQMLAAAGMGAAGAASDKLKGAAGSAKNKLTGKRGAGNAASAPGAASAAGAGATDSVQTTFNTTDDNQLLDRTAPEPDAVSATTQSTLDANTKDAYQNPEPTQDADTPASPTIDPDDYQPGTLTRADAIHMAHGDEQLGTTIHAMDQKLGQLSQAPSEGTKAGKEVAGGMIAGTSGAAAGATVGKTLGAFGGSVIGPAGTAAGAAIGGAVGGAIGGAGGYLGKQMVGAGSVRGGWDRAKTAGTELKNAALDKAPDLRADTTASDAGGEDDGIF